MFSKFFGTFQLSWYIGIHNHWQCNSGYHGKWFQHTLTADLWVSFEKTYAGFSYAEMWESLFEAGRLIRQIGLEIADNLGYTYPLQDDQRVTAYLKQVRQLPKDAGTLD